MILGYTLVGDSMNKKIFFFNLLFPLFVGMLSAFLVKDSFGIYASINKPFLAPPSILFPIVWTILYLLMGLSSYFISQSHSLLKEKAFILYGFQLLLNFIWPTFFFTFSNYFFSLLILLILLITVIYMLMTFNKISNLAFYLNIPYLLWLLFAFYLNFMIFLNN